MSLINLMIEDISNIDGFLIFSGNTGGMSGFKSLLCQELNDHYSKTTKIELAIADSDITSNVLAPYNSVFQFGSNQPSDSIFDGSILLDNESITCAIVHEQGVIREGPWRRPVLSFEEINKTLAQALSAMTSTFRYRSNMNSTLSEFGKNMSFNERLNHFMITYSHSNPKNMFSSFGKLAEECLFTPANHMLAIDPRNGLLLNSCLTLIGQELAVSEAQKIIEQVPKLKKDWFNSKVSSVKCGFSKQPCDQQEAFSLISSTSFKEHLERDGHKFDLMFAKRAYFHWFTSNGMDEMDISEYRHRLGWTVEEYTDIENEFRPEI